MRYLTLLSLLAIMAFPARGAFTINLDAGELTSPVAQPMQADNLSGSLNGSLLLILDLGSSQSLSNNIDPGNYVSGTNFVLAAGGFNTNGGTNETLTSFYVSSTPAASVGDVIALRWFPQITLSQYNSGSLPLAGQSFGSYTPNPVGSTPDGGDQWLVPTSGLIDLSMYTVNSDGGGSQAALAGYAGSQIETIPEPSTYTLLGMGLFLLFFHRRRAPILGSGLGLGKFLKSFESFEVATKPIEVRARSVHSKVGHLSDRLRVTAITVRQHSYGPPDE